MRTAIRKHMGDFVALTMLSFTLGFVTKLPCSYHPWAHNYQYTRLCYTDVFALYFSEGINEHKVIARQNFPAGVNRTLTVNFNPASKTFEYSLN